MQTSSSAAFHQFGDLLPSYVSEDHLCDDDQLSLSGKHHTTCPPAPPSIISASNHSSSANNSAHMMNDFDDRLSVVSGSMVSSVGDVMMLDKMESERARYSQYRYDQRDNRPSKSHNLQPPTTTSTPLSLDANSLSFFESLLASFPAGPNAVNDAFLNGSNNGSSKGNDSNGANTAAGGQPASHALPAWMDPMMLASSNDEDDGLDNLLMDIPFSATPPNGNLPQFMPLQQQMQQQQVQHVQQQQQQQQHRAPAPAPAPTQKPYVPQSGNNIDNSFNAFMSNPTGASSSRTASTFTQSRGNSMLDSTSLAFFESIASPTNSTYSSPQLNLGAFSPPPQNGIDTASIVSRSPIPFETLNLTSKPLAQPRAVNTSSLLAQWDTPFDSPAASDSRSNFEFPFPSQTAAAHVINRAAHVASPAPSVASTRTSVSRNGFNAHFNHHQHAHEHAVPTPPLSRCASAMSMVSVASSMSKHSRSTCATLASNVAAPAAQNNAAAAAPFEPANKAPPSRYDPWVRLPQATAAQPLPLACATSLCKPGVGGGVSPVSLNPYSPIAVSPSTTPQPQPEMQQAYAMPQPAEIVASPPSVYSYEAAYTQQHVGHEPHAVPAPQVETARKASKSNARKRKAAEDSIPTPQYVPAAITQSSQPSFMMILGDERVPTAEPVSLQQEQPAPAVLPPMPKKARTRKPRAAPSTAAPASTTSNADAPQSTPQIPCPVPTCNKTFPTLHAIKSHLRCHNDATLPCPHPGCTLTFRRNHDLVRHRRSMHDMGKPHACPDCDRSFARADALRRHRETVSAHRCKGLPLTDEERRRREERV
ncbi:hypothetical protein HK101_005189, partial [Irineochytrium annulatum]